MSTLSGNGPEAPQRGVGIPFGVPTVGKMDSYKDAYDALKRCIEMNDGQYAFSIIGAFWTSKTAAQRPREDVLRDYDSLERDFPELAESFADGRRTFKLPGWEALGPGRIDQLYDARMAAKQLEKQDGFGKKFKRMCAVAMGNNKYV